MNLPDAKPFTGELREYDFARLHDPARTQIRDDKCDVTRNTNGFERVSVLSPQTSKSYM